MRFYDRIIANKFQPLPQIRQLGYGDLSDYNNDMREIWSRLTETDPTILVINNVAEYFYSGVGRSPWSWNPEKDFPNLAPPWDHQFIEYKAPTKLMTSDGETVPWSVNNGIAFGVLITSLQRKPDQSWFEETDDSLLAWLSDEARWIQIATVFLERSNKEILCAGQAMWTLRADGTMIPDRSAYQTKLFGGESTAEKMPLEMQNKISELSMWSVICAASLATTFIHCRNVKVIENTPPPKLVKATERRHRITPVTYRTLEIEPVKKILATEGNAAEVGQQKALHICRGHFKDYRQHGIFGRNHGLYWWNMHARGTLDRGLVMKDYVAPGGVA